PALRRHGRAVEEGERVGDRAPLPPLGKVAVPARVEVLEREPEPGRDLRPHLVPDRSRPLRDRVPKVEDDRANAGQLFRALTAAPYAQISVQFVPISEVSKRIATIASAPFASAS